MTSLAQYQKPSLGLKKYIMINICVIGYQRTGHHAVTSWIGKQIVGKCLISDFKFFP